MATLSSRVSGIGENVFGDQEKDSNALLLELDKGLRSGKVGEQCEAIVRYPELFEKYPFPILINSAFLKVADVFRVGSNFLRLCVLRVTQQSEKHLQKITSVDEFLRRIYTVIHSNDPVARALTLRTLGSIVCIIAERKNVHHSIINSLDSHDSVELEAAICAASLFAAKSKSFAGGVCGKLSEMLDRTSVPLDIKLKLVSIFEHMRFDPDNYEKVRMMCTQMLIDYPSCKFVVAVLRTLTHLSACLLVDIPAQLELLLKYYSEDVRRAVKLSVLTDMAYLAKCTPHMWTSQLIVRLCSAVTVSSSDDDVHIAVLNVLLRLSHTVAVANLSPAACAQLVDCCLGCCYHDNTLIVATAAEIYVGIVSLKWKDSCFAESKPFQLDHVCTVLEMALSVSVARGSLKDNQKILVSVVRLCRLDNSFTDRFVDVITSCVASLVSTQLTDDDRVKTVLLLCDSLSAIDDIRNGVLCSLVPDLMSLMSAVTRPFAPRETTTRVTLAVVRLLLQACARDGLSSDVSELIDGVCRQCDGWMAYKIGRQAARFSHHALASAIFARLTLAASTEHNQFWLAALRDCCAAESCLLDDGPSTTKSDFAARMFTAESHYHAGIVALKAAATPAHPLTFQVEYAQLRAAMLPAFARVIHASCSFQTSPPPAIAASLAVTTGLEKHRCEHVLVQLQKCSQTFTDLDHKYHTLAQSLFDADPATFANIQGLQMTCRLMSDAIKAILSCPGSEGMSLSSREASDVEGSSWSLMRREVKDLLQTVMHLSDSAPITDQHMDCIQKIAVLLARVRHCLPRYMFQRLQTTTVKLAVTPTPRTADEPIVVHYDTRLTLKIEGVVQVTSHSKRLQRVKAVELLVHSTQQSRSPTLNADTVAENPSNKMVETATPHNEYFSVQLLLAFPLTGLHQVIIETLIVDVSGARWNTGPRCTLLVKSFDEAMQRQQQLHYANQPRPTQPPPPPRSQHPARTH